MTAVASVYLEGRRLHLDDKLLLGEGGEGRVYRVAVGARTAVKIFHQPTAARAAKLRAFGASQMPAEVIAPTGLCTDSAGAVIGYAMPALEQAFDLQRFAQRRWREGRVGNAAVLEVFAALASTIATLHTRGIVVGDLNDGNVVVTAEAARRSGEAATWRPWLIDADSMQLPGHPCTVAHERFLDPRLYGLDLAGGALDRASDWYALAVLLFGSLLYTHPFGGSHPAHGTMLRRAEARISILRADVKRPAAGTRPDVLPDDALAWFERVFEQDLRAPLPAALLEARFVTCTCGQEHARVRCPYCTVRVLVAPVVRALGNLRSTRVVHCPRGRIVAASADGPLRYVLLEAGILRREDGTIVVADGEPTDLVRIAGNATWLGVGRVVRKIVGGVEHSTRPVDLVHGDLAADAGPEGLVVVQGDALVRAERETRIGQVLEGQTRVRTSATLGFAFYRAGGFTVAFVFDPRRGPLRQVEGFPHLAGRLVGWSAVFDEAHVLVTFATENGHDGAVTHTAHLVDARGELVASDHGEVLFPSLAGRALSNGSVLLATQDGLVLVRADRAERAFVPARLFPEARDLVSPEADLLVGPGGSLFVVGHDEITHLCFTP